MMSMYHLSATGKASFGYDFKCIEQFEKGPNDINKSFEFMLTELPRRAFSQDPLLNADYETDNDDNRKFKFAATSVRSEVQVSFIFQIFFLYSNTMILYSNTMIASCPSTFR